MKDESKSAKIDEVIINEQKYEAIARLIGGVAHDFNNIISIISGNAQLCLMKLEESDTELKEYLNPILKACERASKIIKQLLITSRKHDVEFKIVNINTLIDNLLKLLKETIGENIEIVTELSKGIWYILANEANLEQVILNLTVNARDAMPAGGRITIKTENIEIDERKSRSIAMFHRSVIKPGKYVKIIFEDTGVGIPRENLHKIFEPYFTTKPKEIGTGLGLAVVLGIVEKHKGYINVESEVNKGTRFTIYLPAIEKAENLECVEEESADVERYRGSGEKIVYVEDEDSLRDIVSKIVSSHGYKVFPCKYFKEALQTLRKHKGEVELLFSDIVLIDGHGLDLADEARMIKPDIRILLTSGYSDSTIRLNKIRDRGYDYISKPYSVVELLKKIKQTIKSPNE